MNKILVTNAARALFNKFGITPDSWNIPESERERICKSGVGIAVSYTPASVMDLKTSPIPPEVSALIIIEGTPLLEEFITPPEQIGMVLHELGHHLNAPPAARSGMDAWVQALSKPEIDLGELYADDYARHCGYGAEFRSAMIKFREGGRFGFDGEEIGRRIGKLGEDRELMFNLRE